MIIDVSRYLSQITLLLSSLLLQCRCNQTIDSLGILSFRDESCYLDRWKTRKRKKKRRKEYVANIEGEAKGRQKGREGMRNRWGISPVGLEHGIGDEGWRRVVARKRGTVIVPPFIPFSLLPLTPTSELHTRACEHACKHACTSACEGPSSAWTSAGCGYDAAHASLA